MRGERGGALLEGALALGLSAMLAAAVVEVGRFGLEALDRAGGRQEAISARLAERRTLAELLARIDAATPGAPSFTGGAEAMAWRGVAPGPDGGWEGGFWRLERGGDGLLLSRCPALTEVSGCEEAGRFAMEGGFSYENAEGETGSDWPVGAPPALIRIGAAFAAQPRVSGAAR